MTIHSMPGNKNWYNNYDNAFKKEEDLLELEKKNSSNFEMPAAEVARAIREASK